MVRPAERLVRPCYVAFGWALIIVSSIRRVLYVLFSIALLIAISYLSIVYYDQLLGACHLCITISLWVLVIHW